MIILTIWWVYCFCLFKFVLVNKLQWISAFQHLDPIPTKEIEREIRTQTIFIDNQKSKPIYGQSEIRTHSRLACSKVIPQIQITQIDSNPRNTDYTNFSLSEPIKVCTWRLLGLIREKGIDRWCWESVTV